MTWKTLSSLIITSLAVVSPDHPALSWSVSSGRRNYVLILGTKHGAANPNKRPSQEVTEGILKGPMLQGDGG